MPAQRTLLHILIASLAAAALLGATVVLTAGNEIADKMIGTLLLTAVGSGLLLGAAHYLSGPQTKAAAFLMTALVIVEFVLASSVIWEMPAQWGIDNDKVLALTAALGGPGLISVICLAMRHERHLSWASWVGLVLSAAVFLLWLKAIGFGEATLFGQDHWWEYGWWLAAMGALACLCTVGAGVDSSHWRWIGFVCAGAAYAFIVPMVDKSNWPPQPVDGLITIATLIAHANLILRAPLRNAERWMIYTTIAVAVATGWFVNQSAMAAVGGAFPQRSLIDRLAAAGGILSGFGTLIVAVLTQLHRRASAHVSVSDGPPDVNLVCPLCGKRQTLPHGRGACDRCGAIIAVTIQSPLSTGASALPS